MRADAGDYSLEVVPLSLEGLYESSVGGLGVTGSGTSKKADMGGPLLDLWGELGIMSGRRPNKAAKIPVAGGMAETKVGKVGHGSGPAGLRANNNAFGGFGEVPTGGAMLLEEGKGCGEGRSGTRDVFWHVLVCVFVCSL